MNNIRHEDSSALHALREQAPTLWLNPQLKPSVAALETLALCFNDIVDASDRLERFAPLLSELFPELKDTAGIIESPLMAVPNLQTVLMADCSTQGSLYIKADHSLPVAGSVKARGGIYEVLVIAETIAIHEGLLTDESSIMSLMGGRAKALFAQHTISVGSTGNLGLSIGVVAAALGFKSEVHMSSDAKDWKKIRLRERGVEVIEHAGDYASAVEAGRQNAQNNTSAHFIDDENSLPLFLGYSVAALRLKEQLSTANVIVDAEHPLFVYIPCGVGGAPGGITFGLKHVFGDHVHCFFAEPVDAPCMLLALSSDSLFTENRQALTVYDIGLKNNTEADGLAVASASVLVANMMRPLVSGIFTVKDESLFRDLYTLYQTESLKIEPSAAAGFTGPDWLLNSERGNSYLTQHQLCGVMSSATHILWTSGGAFVPDKEFERFLHQGASQHYPV